MPSIVYDASAAMRYLEQRLVEVLARHKGTEAWVMVRELLAGSRRAKLRISSCELAQWHCWLEELLEQQPTWYVNGTKWQYRGKVARCKQGRRHRVYYVFARSKR